MKDDWVMIVVVNTSKNIFVEHGDYAKIALVVKTVENGEQRSLVIITFCHSYKFNMCNLLSKE